MMQRLYVTILIICAVASTAVSRAENDATDYAALAAVINSTLRANLYNPAELDSPSYRRVETAVAALAARSSSDDEFLDGFREVWHDGPFSHVELRPAHQSASDVAAYLDTLRIGGGGATLTWMDDIALLTVKTMMGLDTIEEIAAAYTEIATRLAAALIIDLRQNGGGAFAVRPLVAHVLAGPADAGGFVSQRWYRTHRRAPSRAELGSVEPWEGWSIQAFWADVQDRAVLRLRFSPAEPVFAGPVYVLTSARTASAAELATDILQSTARATVIGERTAGAMLSQKMYDLPGGFHLSLPIADYYSARSGRIEGVGISPDIECNAADALDVALQHHRSTASRRPAPPPAHNSAPD